MTWSTPTRALSVLALLFAAVSAVLLVTGRDPLRLVADVGGVDVGLHLDVLSTVLLAFVACLTWLVARYAHRNVAGQPGSGRFGALQLALTVGLLLLVSGASLPVMAVGWTTAGLALAALVGHAGTQSARRASRYVRRVLLVGDAALWAGVALALATLPTVDRTELADADLPVAATTAVALLLLVACAVRSALAPAHRWLPETAEAPSPVSALLHAGVVNGAGVLLTLLWPLVTAAPVVMLLLLVLGTASVVVGTMAARVREDVKGRLASSTTSQMGYMAVQLGLGLPAAAVLHLVGHGFWKSWLFLRAGGAVSRARGSAGTSSSTGTGTGATGAVLATVAVAVMLLAAGPALLHSWEGLGPVAAVPALLAGAGVAVAAASAARRGPGGTGTPVRLQALVAGLAAVSGAAYLWLVVGTEVLLAPSLPVEPLWSASVAGVLVGVLVLTAASLLVALRRLARPGHLAVLMSGSALAPWTRHVRGTARIPSLAPAVDGGGRASVPGGVDVDADPSVRADTDADLDGDRDLDVIDLDADRESDRDLDRHLDIEVAVRAAVADLAPAWPLRSLVAASGLAGLEHLPVEQAHGVAEALLGADTLLPARRYDDLLRTGRIGVDDVADAVRLAAFDEDRPLTDAQVDWTVEGILLAGAGGALPTREPVGRPGETAPQGVASDQTHPSLCELADRASGRPDRLRAAREDHASVWCQRAWSRADATGPGPWHLWRAHATLRSYDVALRLRGASALVAGLPVDPTVALTELLRVSGLTGPRTVAYLRGLLAAAPGWTGHALWRARRDGDMSAVVELLALRAALDALVAGSRHAHLTAPAGSWPAFGTVASPGAAATTVPVQGTGPDGHHEGHGSDEVGGPADLAGLDRPDPRHVWQLAYELGYGTRLLESLTRPAAPSSTGSTGSTGTTRDLPAVQWVACIDVRSERVRRHLEAVGDVDTFGFAGFFGVDLDHRHEDGTSVELCPALLRPSVPCTTPPVAPGAGSLLDRAVGAVSQAPLVPLLVAEAGGTLAGVAALARTLAPAWWGRVSASLSGASPDADDADDAFGGRPPELAVDLQARVALAAGALRGTGLVGGLAPLVVLCGHGATVENNAFAAAYDCGACGGNPGGLNARAMAALLNDPAVRAGLAEQGVHVPAGTVFLAAMHDTTTDDLLLDPRATVPARHEPLVERLRVWAAAASARTREERLAMLPGYEPVVGDEAAAARREARNRSQDWAQPFPEWGLAGNAAIVVGPRDLTRGADLDGRVFLHSYDAALDPDGAVLEQVLTAPVVVAHWISSQYRLSTVSPEVLGAGDKTTHNVVGDVAVLTGAHGDIRTGLPWQALFSTDPRLDPASSRHEPLRLLVVVHARPDAVSRVLAEHADLADLTRNGWLRMATVDPEDGGVRMLARSGRWVAWDRVRPVAPVPGDLVPLG